MTSIFGNSILYIVLLINALSFFGLFELDKKHTKYYDYFLSVNREYKEIKMDTDIEKILEQFKPYKCSIDIRKMIEIFPYIDDDIKNDCLYKLSNGFLNYLQ
jgi:hypothetical protein